jgi:hypothetical protein
MGVSWNWKEFSEERKELSDGVGVERERSYRLGFLSAPLDDAEDERVRRD